MLDHIQSLLSKFSSTTLKEIEKSALMNRVDEKFVIPLSKLDELLTALQNEYHVLQINGLNVFQYSSLYFDCKDYRFYLDHHNGRSNRNKVRIRKYCDTGETYLEVKKKTKERTIKKRIKIADFTTDLSDENKTFIQNQLGNNADLQAVLYNDYKRITLIHKTKTERVTFDFDIRSKSVDLRVEKNKLAQLVIVEIKQERADRSSILFQTMKAKHIRPLRISKFCFGIFELYDNLALKSNRFKPRLMQLHKVLQ
jgi:hypothetical protein